MSDGNLGYVVRGGRDVLPFVIRSTVLSHMILPYCVVWALSSWWYSYNQARKIAYIPFPFAHAQITCLFVLVIEAVIPVLMLTYLEDVLLGFVLNLLTVMCFAGRFSNCFECMLKNGITHNATLPDLQASTRYLESSKTLSPMHRMTYRPTICMLNSRSTYELCWTCYLVLHLDCSCSVYVGSIWIVMNHPERRWISPCSLNAAFFVPDLAATKG